MNPKERTEGECGSLSIAQGACVCTCLCEIALSLQCFRPQQLPGGRKPCARHAPSHCKVTSTWNKCVSLQSCTLSQDLDTRVGFPALRNPHLCYFTLPLQDFCLRMEIPFPSGSGYARASTHTSSTTTLNCSSLHSGSDSHNLQLFLHCSCNPLKTS